MKSLIFLLLATTLQASWKNQIISYQSGTHSPFKPEKLEYTMSWKGTINSGKLTIEFGKKDPRYPKVFLSHAYGRSTGIAYAAFPYTFTFTSFAKLSDHRPLVFVATEKDNKEDIETKNSYKSPGIHHHSITTIKKTKKSLTESHRFAAKAVHDPITAMLAIRKQPLPNGATVQLCCHPFASPYLVTVTVLGREKHLGYNCIKLDIKLRKIDKSTGKLLTYKKLKYATMWITDDTQRIPVELRSKVFIGDVRATLTKRSPL
ncbi:DUF3108 domain-containing protein [Rubritalea tangerina]|uniref:DUF3108 domain-containing protein n=1 Tax=Rubritalea tangerina TaxID=430798 RepID=A0ABW4Z6J5_9BACT